MLNKRYSFILFIFLIFIISLHFIASQATTPNNQCGGQGFNCYNQPSECACNTGYVCEYHQESINGGTSMWGECVYTGSTGCVPGQERDCQGNYVNTNPGVCENCVSAFGQECINGVWGSCVPRQQCGANGGIYVNCNEGNGFLLYDGLCVHTRISGSGENEFWSYEDCYNKLKETQTPTNGITVGVTQTSTSNSNNFPIVVIAITTVLVIFLICLTIFLIKRKK